MKIKWRLLRTLYKILSNNKKKKKKKSQVADN
jgi:hypothetical protein